MKVLPAKSKEVNNSSQAIAFNNLSSPLVNDSADDYESLKLKLFVTTLILSGLIFLAVGNFYGLKVALNYLLGAVTGVVYLKMLARSIDELGKKRRRLGYSRLAVFVGVIILASRLHQLQILPIFFGFMTYKAAILVYLAQDFIPRSKTASS